MLYTARTPSGASDGRGRENAHRPARPAHDTRRRPVRAPPRRSARPGPHRGRAESRRPQRRCALRHRHHLPRTRDPLPRRHRRPRRFHRRHHEGPRRRSPHPRRRRRRRQERKGPLRQGLRQPGHRQRHPRRSGHEPLPHRLHLQALHLDRRHAARRAGKARPRRRRQLVSQDLQDQGRLRQARTHSRSHDPLRRLGRWRARLPHHRGLLRRRADRHHAAEAPARIASGRRARSPRTRTTAPRSPGSSSSR